MASNILYFNYLSSVWVSHGDYYPRTLYSNCDEDTHYLLGGMTTVNAAIYVCVPPPQRSPQISGTSQLYTGGSWLNNGWIYSFLTLQWCERDRHSEETILWIFNFDFFPMLVIGSMILSCDVRQQHQQGAAPSRPCDHKGKQPIDLQPFCSHITILVFIFSSQWITGEIQYFILKQAFC